jgi:hypothetical protein
VTLRRPVLVIACVLLVAAPTGAQTYASSRNPRLGTVEAGVGAAWIGGVDFGERRAEELRNPAAAVGSGPLVLFATKNKLESTAGVQARFGVYLTRGVILEAGLRYSRPVLVARLSNDFEQAEDVMAKETLSHYVFDGSVVYEFAHFSLGRVAPFVLGGAGHIRDLHQRGELVETGTEYHGGAGVKVWLGDGAHRVGIRGDIAVSSRRGGFDLEPKRRTVPVAAASLIFLF